MLWSIHVLRSPEEKTAGVKQFPSPLPVDALLFFPWITTPGAVSMQGVDEPLRVYILGQTLGLIHRLTMQPGEVLALPPDACHVVESSAEAPVESDFYRLLGKYL